MAPVAASSFGDTGTAGLGTLSLWWCPPSRACPKTSFLGHPSCPTLAPGSVSISGRLKERLACCRASPGRAGVGLAVGTERLRAPHGTAGAWLGWGAGP